MFFGKNFTMAAVCAAIGLLSVSIPAQAKPYPDELGICYGFNDDELQSADVCLIQSASGIGEQYTTLQWNQKTYDILSNGSKYLLNDSDAVFYLRDAAFYQPLSDSEVLSIDDGEPVLFCYKSRSLDICHN